MDGREQDQVNALDPNILGLSDEEKKNLMADMATNQHHLDPQQVLNALQSQTSNCGINVSDLYDVSIKGQQYDNSCGLDTALNAAAIIKTYINYNTAFNLVAFKKALDNNIYYQRKDDGYYIYGKKSSLTQEEIVKRIGNDLLLRSLNQDQYRNGIQQPQNTIQEALARLQDQSPEHNSNIPPAASQSDAQFIESNSNDISAQPDFIQPQEEFVEDLSTSSGDDSEYAQFIDNNHAQPEINDTQKTQFYNDLNAFLQNDTNKKLLAKYIKDNCIEVKENDSQLQVVDSHLQNNMKEVIDMAKGDQNISLGLINGFIIYLANLVGWEQSNLFDIVNKNTTAKSWAEKIKENNKVEGKDTLPIMQ